MYRIRCLPHHLLCILCRIGKTTEIFIYRIHIPRDRKMKSNRRENIDGKLAEFFFLSLGTIYMEFPLYNNCYICFVFTQQLFHFIDIYTYYMLELNHFWFPFSRYIFISCPLTISIVNFTPSIVGKIIELICDIHHKR